jgi:hypothetical protein
MPRTKAPASRNVAKASHSIRTTDELWAAAKRRADSEGTTMNTVINEIMEGYARGYIDLPKITKSYKKTAVPSP